jgi:hypothetical protein
MESHPAQEAFQECPAAAAAIHGLPAPGLGKVPTGGGKDIGGRR